MEKYIAKEIISGPDALKKLASGAQKLTDAVVATLGPRSKNVILNRNYPAPWVVHDGASIAKEIRLEDPFEDMGAQLVKEAALNTNTAAGDGTTTATLLANTLIQDAVKLIIGDGEQLLVSSKVDVMELSDQLLAYGDYIIEKLDKMTKKLTTKAEKQFIAEISAGKPDLGKKVFDIIEKIGVNGIVMAEDAPGTFTIEEEYQEGYEWDNGYLSPYLVSNSDSMTVDYKDCYVLITDQRITNAQDLTPIVTKIYETEGPKKPLVIIADDVQGPAMKGIILTKAKLGHEIVAVIAPEWAERRKESLRDLAMLTGATLFSQELNMSIVDAKISDLGRARNVFMTAHKTILTPLNTDKEELEERVNELKTQIKAEENDWKRGRMEERLAKLTQSVAIVKIGGGSEAEIAERKERLIDAVSAVKAAITDGIIPGGGVALFNISTQLVSELVGNEKDGIAEDLIFSMLTAPIKTILSNSGLNINNYNYHLWKPGTGVNVTTKKEGNMMEMGVIDPVKVTKLAVRHAISTAAMFITTNVLVTDKVEKEDKK